MKKSLVLILIALISTIIFGGCGTKQNINQVNNPLPSNQPTVNIQTNNQNGNVNNKKVNENIDTETKLSSNVFDMKKIKVGDKVANMPVIKTDIKIDKEQHYGCQGDVWFSGEKAVTGKYEHFPDGMDGEYVSFILDETSTNSLPIAIEYLPYLQDGINKELPITFINDNKEIFNIFGPIGSKGKATIVIGEYRARYGGPDIYHFAKLIKVVEKTPIK